MQSVNELCEKGNSLSEVGMYQEALSCFKHALEKTPETYDYEDERVWILVAIGGYIISASTVFKCYGIPETRIFFMIRETRL